MEANRISPPLHREEKGLWKNAWCVCVLNFLPDSVIIGRIDHASPKMSFPPFRLKFVRLFSCF